MTPLPMVTFAAEDELWIERLPVFCPTRPPAMIPVNAGPALTVLAPGLDAVTLTFVTVPLFTPASGPRN